MDIVLYAGVMFLQAVGQAVSLSKAHIRRAGRKGHILLRKEKSYEKDI